MPPRANCDRLHLDEGQVQLTREAYTELLAAQPRAQAAMDRSQQMLERALDAQMRVADAVAKAVEQERQSWLARMSSDASGLADATKILVGLVDKSTEHHKDRDVRILALQAQNGDLLAEVARLKAERGDLALVQYRERQSAEIKVAEIQATTERFAVAMRQLAPLAPLLLPLIAKFAGNEAAEAFATATATANAGAAPGAPPGATWRQAPPSAGEPEVVDAVAWSRNGVQEWKEAIADIVLAVSDEDAAVYRMQLQGLIQALSAPVDALPAMIRPVVRAAGPERIARLQELTRAAQPQPS